MAKCAAITMDLEDFEDISSLRPFALSDLPSMMDGFERFLAILERRQIKATFFVLFSRLEKDEGRIRLLLKKGHSIALHGYDHHCLGKDPLETFVKEISLAKKALEERFGVRIQGFRAPALDIRDEQLAALSKMGFVYDSSKASVGRIFPLYAGNPSLTGYTRIEKQIWEKNGFYEFGQSISEGPLKGGIIGGSVLLRFPPMFVIKRALTRFLRNNDFYLWYCHPFELSWQKAPKIKHLALRDRYYVSFGRKRFAHRFERVLDLLTKEGYHFLTLEECSALLKKKQGA